MKLTRLALAISLTLPATAALSATYYVDSNAPTPNGNGTQASPFKTLAQVNAMTLASGSVVKLACGSTWSETLQVRSGVTYEADNSSCTNKPIIRGSDPLNTLTWQLDSSDASGKVYWADATSLGLSDMGHVFYASILRMTRARHPNVGADLFTSGNRYDRLQPGTQHYGVVVPDLSKLTPEQQAAASSEGWNGARLYHWFGGYMLQQLDLSTQGTDIVAGPPGPESTYPHLNYNHDEGTQYYLENRRWMLDAEGEWYYNAANKRIYMWAVGGSTPQGKPYYAAKRVYGISAINVGGFTLRNIQVMQTLGDAVHIENPGSAAFTISGMTINQAGLRGIFVKGGVNGAILNNTIYGSRSIGIALGEPTDISTAPASNITVSNNAVTRTGEQLYAVAAIRLARGNTASNNTVDRATGIGILANRETKVTGNTVTQTCASASDCGAVYLIGRDDQGHFGYPLNTEISSNRIDTVQPFEGDSGAKSVGARGIYLDDWATLATVKGNFVTNAGIGVQLHFGRGITVSDNFLINNRVAQIKLEEASTASKTVQPMDCGTGEALIAGLYCNPENFMVSNVVQNNVMLASDPAAKLVHQQTEHESTDDFGTYSNNAYVAASATPFYDEAGSSAALDSSHTRLNKGWSFAFWRSLSNHDQVGSQYLPNLAGLVVTGGPLTLPQFDNGFLSSPWWTGFPSDPVTSPSGVKGVHIVVPDALRGSLHLFTDSVVPLLKRGDSFLMSFEAKAANGFVRAALRQSIPQVVTDEVSFLLGGDQWRTYSRVITVTEDTTALGQLVMYLDTPEVSLANLRIVPITQTVEADSVKVFDNWGTTSISVSSCGSANGVCNNYIDAKTGAAVTFPLTVNAKSARVLVRSTRAGKDDDLDGVANGQDACASTPTYLTPNAKGCQALTN